MPSKEMRFLAFFAVVVALLNAGAHFQQGHVAATLYFMVGAILLTIVTHLNVRKKTI